MIKFGNVCWSDLCFDVANKLEELNTQNEKIKETICNVNANFEDTISKEQVLLLLRELII